MALALRVGILDSNCDSLGFFELRKLLVWEFVLLLPTVTSLWAETVMG